jgi:hypothetical protein
MELKCENVQTGLLYYKIQTVGKDNWYREWASIGEKQYTNPWSNDRIVTILTNFHTCNLDGWHELEFKVQKL